MKESKATNVSLDVAFDEPYTFFCQIFFLNFHLKSLFSLQLCVCEHTCVEFHIVFPSFLPLAVFVVLK